MPRPGRYNSSTSTWVVNDLINRSLTQNITGTATALAVNASGVAVGNSSLAGFPSLNSCAAEFTGNGTAINLGNLYNGSTSALNGSLDSYPEPMSAMMGTDVAMDINDSGVIVGDSATAQNGASPHAFIYGYQGYNHMQDMNTVFSSIIPSGWTLVCASAIDDNGDITGMASNSSGRSEGFLLQVAALPGDANGDGKVDINDLTIVLNNYGKAGQVWSQGSMDGDPTGTVDINDLTIVLDNYGQSLHSAGPGIAAVPEPGTLLLLAVALLPTTAIFSLSRGRNR